MISQMLSRTPEDRPRFDHILSSFRGTIFPEYFYTFLKDYTSSLNELPDTPDSSFLQKAAPAPGTKIDRMLDEWESIQIHLEGTGPEEHLDQCKLYLYLMRMTDKQPVLRCSSSTWSHHPSGIVSGPLLDFTASSCSSISYHICRTMTRSTG